MSDNNLDYVKQLINSQGKITFARFMEIALYHPEIGYYNSEKQIIGKGGDYYTAPDVHSFMGQVLGKYLVEMWKRLNNEDFFIIEIGAGKGLMALDIIEYINKNFPNIYKCLTYFIIEKSKSLKVKQKNLLYKYIEKIEWLDSIFYFKNHKDFTGYVLSNELIDALPFHRVQQCKNKLKEIFISLNRDQLVDEIDELSTDRLLDYFKRINITLAEGMKTEVNLEAMNWINNIASIMDKGFVITIDYGFPAHLYYSSSKYNGTFLCYYNHSINENPYEKIGRQDITAHVDFTSLALEGKEVGLDLLAYTDLASFLMVYGKDILEQEIKKVQHLDKISAFKATTAIKNLIHPEGMGGAFKVLIQGKNVEPGVIIDNQYNKMEFLGLK